MLVKHEGNFFYGLFNWFKVELFFEIPNAVNPVPMEKHTKCKWLTTVPLQSALWLLFAEWKSVISPLDTLEVGQEIGH